MRVAHITRDKVNQLPPKITHLQFGSSFNQPINHLPPNTHLKFGKIFAQTIDHHQLEINIRKF